MACQRQTNPMKIEKLPYIYRLIPELNHQKIFTVYRRNLKIFTVLIFLLAVVVVGLDLQKNIQKKQTVDFERKKLMKELAFWEQFIHKHKDYKDAFFQASILEYRLGNVSSAKMYAEKGLSLDPNSENGKKIEEFLDK